MRFSKYIKVLRERPDYIFTYLFRRIKNNLNKKFYYKDSERYIDSINNKANYKILKAFAVSDYSELLNFMKSKRIRIFLTSNIIDVIKDIKSDIDYKNQILLCANKALNNEFYILNNYREEMFDPKTFHYKWFKDYIQNTELNITYFSESQKSNSQKGIDIKRVWETARMQYLFSLGLAYRITKDEKYAKKIISVINDFISQNPYDTGPNWSISMEAGIRLANMLLAYEFIQDSPSLNANFIKSFLTSAYEHYYHIINNQENIGGKTSNHYLGGLLGIAACKAFFTAYGAKNLIHFNLNKSFHRELYRQILKDGSNFEGSVCYHRLSSELFLFTALTSENSRLKIDLKDKEILLSAANFTASLINENGIVPQIGDNDSGRVFQLLPENSLDNRSMIKLAYGLLNKTKPDFIKNDGFELFTGTIDNIFKISEENSDIFYKDMKLIIMKKNNLKLFFHAIDTQKYRFGGHLHNDNLSFELWYNGIPFIVDPGTACYTSDRELRNLMRSISSHSTVCIDGKEQKAITNDIFKWDKYILSTFSFAENTASGTVKYSNNLSHTRNTEHTDNGFVINDYINGNFNGLSCSLILNPEINVSVMSDNKVVLKHNNFIITLDGSWQFEIGNSFYSRQYDSHETTVKIIAKSNSNYNYLRISI